MFMLRIIAILVILSSCASKTNKEKIDFIKENYKKIEEKEKKKNPNFKLEKLESLIDFAD